MNIWAKMMTALRGGVTEAGEAIVDSQALRILDQEIRDAAEELNQSKNGLADMLARQKIAAEKCKQIKKEISTHEGYAVKALEQGDEALAHEVAVKIADFENQLAQEDEARASYESSVAKLRASIQQAEYNLKRLKQQVDTVKATESVQRAQSIVAERHSGSNSKMQNAMDSLERIKERQQLKAAKMEAAQQIQEENADVSLQQKLEAAGITASSNSADEILERLKNKK